MANKKAVETPIDIKAMSLEDLQAHAQSQSEKIEELTAAATESATKIEELTAAATESATKIEELTAEVAVSNAKVDALSAEVDELTQLNAELVAKSELTAGLKADMYIHEDKAYKAISPSFNYKGKIVTAKEIEGNTALIAELVACGMLTPVEKEA